MSDTDERKDSDKTNRTDGIEGMNSKDDMRGGANRWRSAQRRIARVAVLAMLFAGSPRTERTAWPAAGGGEFELRVIDAEDKQPIAVRMHLKDALGKPVKAAKLPFWHDHFVVPGKAVLELRPGRYTFEMERGPEYRVRTGHFEIRRGDADSREVTMERFVDMKHEGWWSGDLHVHRALSEIELLMRAEDLHVVPVITWTNVENAWTSNAAPPRLVARIDSDRFYQVMAGEDERAGGALLYFNLPGPLPLVGADRESPSSSEYLAQARQTAAAHVAAARPFDWDLPVWVASGHVDSIGLCNDHMQRDQMWDSESDGKPRERIEYPAPHGNGRWSQAIYYRLLDCGWRIPPSAGSGSGAVPNPVGYNRVYVHCGPQLDYDAWWRNLRAGQVVVTNGPLIRDPRVNGQLPGHVFLAAAGQTVSCQATLNLSIREPVDYLEIVKDGAVAHEVRLQDWAAAGGRLPQVAFDHSGWMLVRAVTSHPKTYRFASTGPWYVEIDGQPRISRRAAQFFFDWVYERARRIDLPPGEQRNAVLDHHRAARDFWRRKVDDANSE